jgi:hypothetical protein
MTNLGDAGRTFQQENTMNPQDNSGRFAATDAIASKLGNLRDEMRNTIREVDDPQGRAVLETGAEVLSGLRQAFVDYADGTEQAWQR